MANPYLVSLLVAFWGFAAATKRRYNSAGKGHKEKKSADSATADKEEGKGETEDSDGEDVADELAVLEKRKSDFQTRVTHWNDLKGEGLEASSTFLSERTRELVLNSLFINLKKPEFASLVKELPGQSNTLLLSGPEGTELYQERLVRAFAKHFHAKLLTVSHEDLLYEHEIERIPRRKLANRPEEASGAAVLDSLDLSLSNSIAKSLISLATFLAAAVAAAALSSGDRPTVLHIGTSSGSSSSSASGASAPSSPSSSEITRTLKIGDRVKYISRPSTDPSVKDNQPESGSTGSVVATYQTMGVRFDRPVPGGNNLSGLCEPGYGHVCYAQDLRPLDGTKTEKENPMLNALFEVMQEASKQEPLIVFIKHADELALNSRASTLFQDKLSKLEGPPHLVIVGSHVEPEAEGKQKDSGLDDLPLSESSEALLDLFPTKVNLQSPKEPALLSVWKKQMELDSDSLRAEDNREVFRQVLKWTNIECDELDKICITEELLADEDAEEVLGWATSFYLRNASEPKQRDKKLVISAESLQYGLRLLKAIEEDAPTIEAPSREKAQEKTLEQQKLACEKLLKKVTAANKFEERILGEVIPPGKIGVRFDDIGALEGVKKSLKELVMLPLRRPELFTRGQLTKPCKGILLFGPPGTGKTMLAKAVATEAGANFINISMSDILSKWLGEAEKNIKAVFSVASKISPTVIFIDEVDSLLGKRGQSNEHETMRKVKNEFMSNWDGLKTDAHERVLVLAATNRPYDLDEAIIRRFPRRLMVELPDAVNRAKILKVILEKEELEPGFDFAKLAAETEGYSGSDLKNLCVAAAYQPIRELLEQEEKERELSEAKSFNRPSIVITEEPSATTSEDATDSAGSEPQANTIALPVPSDEQAQLEQVQSGRECTEGHCETAEEAGSAPEAAASTEEESKFDSSSRRIDDEKWDLHVAPLPAKAALRALTMDDMKKAQRQISASVAGESSELKDLKGWNESYGENGSRRKETLTYFL